MKGSCQIITLQLRDGGGKNLIWEYSFKVSDKNKDVCPWRAINKVIFFKPLVLVQTSIYPGISHLVNTAGRYLTMTQKSGVHLTRMQRK